MSWNRFMTTDAPPTPPPQPPWPVPGVTMHEWTSTVVLLLSMVFSLLLLGMCLLFFWRIQPTQLRNKPMIMHVLMIAIADFGAAFWTYASSCLYNHTFIFKGDPPWCLTFRFVRWWLVLQSALWATSLALGVFFVLLNWRRLVACQRCSAVWILPLSFVMALPCVAYHNQDTYDKDVPQNLCTWANGLDRIFATEMLALLCITVFVHAFVVHRTRRTLPGSVLTRSVRVATRYILAFWATFGLFACRSLCNVIDCEAWRPSHWWLWYDFISWRLMLLNGFFNFIALGLHVRDALYNRIARGPHSSVTLNAQVEVREVSEVDFTTWTTTCEAQITRIQETRQVWRMFGINLDDDEEEEEVPEATTSSLPRFPSRPELRLDWYPREARRASAS
mmetsp:Transcript_45458/g.83186  ORF Transcript_45458/g.83186 Transcript_45458/m.83186 type:complete len:391 (+) Transcript_45458:97-1269(+)